MFTVFQWSSAWIWRQVTIIYICKNIEYIYKKVYKFSISNHLHSLHFYYLNTSVLIHTNLCFCMLVCVNVKFGLCECEIRFMWMWNLVYVNVNSVYVNVKFGFNISKKYIEAVNENLRVWTKLEQVARGQKRKWRGRCFIIAYFRPHICRVKKSRRIK